MKLNISPEEMRRLIYLPTTEEMQRGSWLQVAVFVDAQPVQRETIMRGYRIRLIFPERLTMASLVEVRVG